MKQPYASTSSSSYKPNTLVDLLGWRAGQHPDKLAYRFLQDKDSETITITYAELDRKAQAIGGE